MRADVRRALVLVAVVSWTNTAQAEKTEEEMIQECRESCGNAGPWGYHPCSCIDNVGTTSGRIIDAPGTTSASTACKTLQADLASNLQRQANFRALAGKRQQLAVIAVHVGDPARLATMAEQIERNASVPAIAGEAAHLRDIVREMAAEGVRSDNRATRNNEALDSVRVLASSIPPLMARIRDLESQQQSLQARLVKECRR